ncbi:MAG: hypothetical protein ACRDL5_05750 [Solirubrobacteraceae bacterium]
MRRRAGAIATAVLAAAALVPSAAGAATLVGGREQSAVARAFRANPAHRDRAIVAILASTLDPTWTAVRSVVPDPSGSVKQGAAPVVQSAYYQRVGTTEQPGLPPAPVRAELSRQFRVAVVFAGSGNESTTYDSSDASACQGVGDFTDRETDVVAPMSWSVRWVVDLDGLLAAVGSASDATLVPSISVDAGASTVDAVESVQRTFQDTGCGSPPTTLTCTRHFRLGGPDPAGALSLASGRGIEVAVPTASAASGACDPSGYALGPSLWDSGAAATVVPRLGLVGGSLPADPYAPVQVSWPRSSAASTLGFATGPCQDEPSCTDRFRWSATVRIEPVTGG